VTGGRSEETYLVFGQIVEAIQAALRAGTPPDVEALIASHPELANDVRQLVATWGLVHHLAHGGEGTPSDPPGCLGDFRLGREIGRGGMGVVYEAVQVSLNRRVALKVLPFAATLDPRRLERFRNEAQAAARLDHPNIVPVYGVGCERGVHFYAMKFIDGQSLAALVEAARRLRDLAGEGAGRPAAAPPPVPISADTPHPTGAAQGPAVSHRTIAGWVADAADALDYAHQVGVVHRDVKPANLLLDCGGRIWLADFGLARLPDESGLTLSGDQLGTLRYMSPEQASGRRGVADHRCDIWSLGATLYELLTLHPAFAGPGRQDVLAQIAEGEPKPPRRFDRSIPADLETVVLKCLRHNPTDRYATAAELADDLRRFLAGAPVRARRPTLRQTAGRWLRRHQGVLAAVAAILFVTACALTISNLLLRASNHAERQQRARAEDNARLALEALDQICVEAVESRAAREPLRARWLYDVLTSAQGYYERLAAENADVPKMREAVQRAHLRIGGIHQLLGRPDEAEQSYARSLAIAESHLADAPEDLSRRGAVAAVRFRLGVLLAETDQTGRAADHLRTAIAAQEQLTADAPGEPLHRLGLALSLLHLARLRTDSAPWEALDHLARSLDLSDSLLADSPSDPRYREAAAFIHAAAGRILLLYGERNREVGRQTTDHYDRAVELLTALASEFPNRPEYRREIARCHNDLGWFWFRVPDRPAAALQFGRAAELFKALVNEFPGVPDLVAELGQALVHQASSRAEGAGEAAEAVRTVEAAIAAHVSPEWKNNQRSARYRAARRNAYEALSGLRLAAGDHAAAAAAAAELPATLPDDWRVCCAAAGLLARCASAADRADPAGAATGASYRARALALFREGAARAGDDPDGCCTLAWYLSVFPFENLRDPDAALRLSHTAVTAAAAGDLTEPKARAFAARAWSSRGMACYRAGRWREAIAALDTAAKYDSDPGAGNGYVWFYRAMSLRRLGDATAGHWCARAVKWAVACYWYARAGAWTKAIQPDNDLLRELRAEAAALLGLPADD
jgi:serine/threonine protein kinase